MYQTIPYCLTLEIRVWSSVARKKSHQGDYRIDRIYKLLEDNRVEQLVPCIEGNPVALQITLREGLRSYTALMKDFFFFFIS